MKLLKLLAVYLIAVIAARYGGAYLLSHANSPLLQIGVFLHAFPLLAALFPTALYAFAL